MNDVAEFMTRNPWFLVAAAIVTFWKPINWANQSSGRLMRWFASPSHYDELDIKISVGSSSYLIARIAKSLIMSFAYVLAGVFAMNLSTFAVVRSSFGTAGFWFWLVLTVLGSAFLTIAILSALYTYVFCDEVAEKLRSVQTKSAEDN